MGPVTNKLGSLTATLLAARRQVWLVQAQLSEDCKKILRNLPFVPGHLFGPNVPELLEKRVKLSEVTRQLMQVQRNPTFRMPAVQTRHHYAILEQRFCRHATPQTQPPQRPCVTEDAIVIAWPPYRELPGGPRQRSPSITKSRTHKASGLRSIIFFIEQLEYWRTNTADHWAHPMFKHFSFLNEVYQFKVLTFSLSLAPRVFTGCVSAALSPLWMRGMHILPNLDDWLLCAPTKSRLCKTPDYF